MASVTVFDKTAGTQKTITVTMETSIIVEDLDSEPDYYIKLSTSALQVGGSAIDVHLIRTLNNGAGTTGYTQHDGSALPYATMTAAIRDHIRRMVEGDLVDPNTAMAF
tara:strand:+ start:370 stop:693 length:324 start_codon:yes stop_codon:yes gene_type:complete